MIEIVDLTVEFDGVRGLNALSVTLDDPISALVGPNGAGKTTLLNVLSGFVRPSGGNLLVDGQDITRLVPHRRAAFGIRRTFQTEQVVENLTVREQVRAVLDNLPRRGDDGESEVHAVLEFVGLESKAEFSGSALAAHDRRMVEIARAVVGKVRLVLMDEPGAGLADAEADHLRQVIVGIPAFCGAQVFLVDHDVELVRATCSSTLVLDFGSRIAYGSTNDVLADPKVRAAYLGVAQGTGNE